MARRRRHEADKPVPAWLLRDDAGDVGDVAAYCRAHGIPVLTLVRYRARLKTGTIRLRRSELAEVATWVIVEGEI